MKASKTKILGLLISIALVCTVARPQTQTTIDFAFNGPFEIPEFQGPKVLPAGAYTFKEVASKSDHDIVQIFKKGRTHSYGTMLAISDRALKPAGKPLVTFRKPIGASPLALKAFSYPGQAYGLLLVYPKSTALELAKANNEPVLSVAEGAAINMDEGLSELVIQRLENAPVKAEKPNGQEIEMSQVITLP